MAVFAAPVTVLSFRQQSQPVQSVPGLYCCNLISVRPI